VFVLPPSAGTLVQRLEGRATEAPDGVESRLVIAMRELQAAPEYDYVVVNDDFVEAVAHVAAILDVEVRRVSRLINLRQVVDHLRRDLAGHQEKRD